MAIEVNPRDWKLWLDDVRDPLTEAPDDRDFVWCRDCHQAMYYTRMWGPPSFMALDHDLGITIDQHVIGGTRTEDVLRYLRWLEGRHPESCPEYRIHSANPEGQKNIISFMESWKKSRALGIKSE